MRRPECPEQDPRAATPAQRTCASKESIATAEVELWLDVLRAHESFFSRGDPAIAELVAPAELEARFRRLKASLDAYRRWLWSHADAVRRLRRDR